MSKEKPIAVLINRNKLTSREYSITTTKGSNKAEVETNIFKENIGQFALEEKKLLNEAGVTTAKILLTKLGQPKLDNEKNSEYEKRIDEEVFEILEIDVNDS